MRWTIFAALGLLPAGFAFAQEPDPNPEPIEGEDPNDDDVKPEAPTPDLPNPTEDTVTYAGVGSDTAYSERGVGEFGGSASFALSNDVTNLSADPMIGYFLWDNLQLSGIIGVRHLSVENENSNRFSVMAEPSVHIPITQEDNLFWMGGIGVGAAFGNDVDNDPGIEAGMAFAPRTGVQFLLGRSGLLNLGARYSAVFSDVDTRVGPLQGQAVLAFANTFDIQAGYTVMF
jgi:hypothetical protein